MRLAVDGAGRGRKPASASGRAVAGFPSGKHVSTVKAHEAAQAVASGAGEIDMVIDVGAALAGDFDAVRSDIAAVRAAVAGAVLKVIVESAVLLDAGATRARWQTCAAPPRTPAPTSSRPRPGFIPPAARRCLRSR